MKRISFKGIPVKCFETPKPMNETVNRSLWILEQFKAKHGRLPRPEDKAFTKLTEVQQVFANGLRKTVTEGLYKRFLEISKHG